MVVGAQVKKMQSSGNVVKTPFGAEVFTDPDYNCAKDAFNKGMYNFMAACRKEMFTIFLINTKHRDEPQEAETFS